MGAYSGRLGSTCVYPGTSWIQIWSGFRIAPDCTWLHWDQTGLLLWDTPSPQPPLCPTSCRSDSAKVEQPHYCASGLHSEQQSIAIVWPSEYLYQTHRFLCRDIYIYKNIHVVMYVYVWLFVKQCRHMLTFHKHKNSNPVIYAIFSLVTCFLLPYMCGSYVTSFKSLVN